MLHPPQTLVLAPDAQAIPLATQWLQGIATHEGWSQQVCLGLVVSLDEAVANIVSYAFPTPPAHGDVPSIALSCRSEDNRILLEVSDNGQPYDPTQATPPPLAGSVDEAQLGGHGLRLMRHYLQDLVYRRHGNWNHLTLVARL